MSVYCPKCGAENPIGSNFCYKCGAKIKKEPPKESVSLSQKSTKNDNSVMNKIIRIFAFGVIVVMAISLMFGPADNTAKNTDLIYTQDVAEMVLTVDDVPSKWHKKGTNGIIDGETTSSEFAYLGGSLPAGLTCYVSKYPSINEAKYVYQKSYEAFKTENAYPDFKNVNIGQESFSAEYARGYRLITVFRKGNVVVEVYSLLGPDTEKYAKIIDKKIDSKKAHEETVEEKETFDEARIILPQRFNQDSSSQLLLRASSLSDGSLKVEHQGGATINLAETTFIIDDNAWNPLCNYEQIFDAGDDLVFDMDTLLFYLNGNLLDTTIPTEMQSMSDTSSITLVNTLTRQHIADLTYIVVDTEEVVGTMLDTVTDTKEAVETMPDTYTLSVGESVDIGDGYTLKLYNLDITGEKVWVVIEKYGEMIDDNVISETDESWNTNNFKITLIDASKEECTIRIR
jgi:hypothetical protein